MNNFRFSKVLLLLFAVCFSLQSCKVYTRYFTAKNAVLNHYSPPFLQSDSLEQSFKASIDVYGHYLGGILVLKKLKPQHYRIAFLSEFGAKFLDTELIGGDMKVNYAIEPLQKKIVLNTLKKDFLILLHEQAEVTQTFQQDDQLIYQSPFLKKQLYYFTDSATGRLSKAVFAGHYREYIQYHYNYRDTAFPDITIHHHGIKLKISLHLLDKAG